MRPLWKGSISFGLVNIPVALHTASRSEELTFKLLRQSDLSPVNYKRVAQVDGKEVPWDQIVKGYEYEKEKFVVLKDEDFKRVDIEASDTIDIIDFVDGGEVNPLYFHRPYYLQALKGGGGAYQLLRQVLVETKKVGIAKIVIRTRQHLAAVRPHEELLVLELMRFSDELVDTEEIPVASGKKPGSRELSMAKTLVEQMSVKWDPTRYTDDYRSALLKLIDKKVAGGGKALPKEGGVSHQRATNVIDLAEVLRQSLEDAAPSRKGTKKATRASIKTTARRKAA